MQECRTVRSSVRFAAYSFILVGATLFPYVARPASSAQACIGTAGSRSAAASAITLAQADENVPPEQIDKYVAVYKSMQHNHRLSVEQAAAAQGLSLHAFRDLEQRIERNDVARDEVRHALATSAEQQTNQGRAAPTPTNPH
jgi:hypothetical protein